VGKPPTAAIATVSIAVGSSSTGLRHSSRKA
jgi:hypothetical protein